MKTLHPDIQSLVEAVGDFTWNTVVEQFERPFRIKKRDRSLQDKLDERLAYALRSAGQAQLSGDDRCEDLDVLKAFGRLVKHASDEYAMVALSAPGEIGYLTSLFASKGTPTSVSIPSGAFRQIDLRVEHRERTRAIYVHNHPRGIVHDIFGGSIGPSARDRDILTHAYGRFLETQGLIESEFYLVENRRFRKFILPSVADAFRFAQQIGVTE